MPRLGEIRVVGGVKCKCSVVGHEMGEEIFGWQPVGQGRVESVVGQQDGGRLPGMWWKEFVGKGRVAQKNFPTFIESGQLPERD